ncbi:hypothetical protein [Anabaena sp. CA = ATCC 33047]|uniref:hypothetical protein n=1 Tax=Anabaena sp. (strain CA / ATCC 33047) TaxID=52271 RepID=UPI00082D831B|nr:hypothetical protein [Anabaena sp. CA = ATCC 33047]
MVNILLLSQANRRILFLEALIVTRTIWIVDAAYLMKAACWNGERLQKLILVLLERRFHPVGIRDRLLARRNAQG